MDLEMVQLCAGDRYQRRFLEALHDLQRDRELTPSLNLGMVHPLYQFYLPGKFELPTSQGKSVDHQNCV